MDKIYEDQLALCNKINKEDNKIESNKTTLKKIEYSHGFEQYEYNGIIHKYLLAKTQPLLSTYQEISALVEASKISQNMTTNQKIKASQIINLVFDQSSSTNQKISLIFNKMINMTDDQMIDFLLNILLSINQKIEFNQMTNDQIIDLLFDKIINPIINPTINIQYNYSRVAHGQMLEFLLNKLSVVQND